MNEESDDDATTVVCICNHAMHARAVIRSSFMYNVSLFVRLNVRRLAKKMMSQCAEKGPFSLVHVEKSIRLQSLIKGFSWTL